MVRWYDLKDQSDNVLDVVERVDEKCLMAYKVVVRHKTVNVLHARAAEVTYSAVRYKMCYECALKLVSEKRLE